MQAQTAFAGLQSAPQAPQSSSEVARSVSQPFSGLPSQSSKPSPQVGRHSPSTQRVLPFSFSHTVPQAPQLSGSSERSISHPVSASSSQSPKPSSHAMAQPRVVHDGSPFTSLHILPHMRQLETVLRLASQRSDSTPLQLA
jgi:hypothetical protein